MITREQLVKLARECAAGRMRTLEDGSVEHRLPAVQDVETWEPFEWLLEAMQRAYEAGIQRGIEIESTRPF